MNASITVETDLFEHREVKPHFINPCCFGEDFAAWLKRELAPLVKEGFEISEPIQRTTAGVSGFRGGKILSGSLWVTSGMGPRKNRRNGLSRLTMILV